VELTWRDLEFHNPDIGLGEFIIMPNHIHGIIQIFQSQNFLCRGGSVTRPLIDNEAGLEPAPTKGIHKRTPLSEIVRQFKTFPAKRINELRGTPGIPVWQRNYYEHIIGSDKEYESITVYIAENPANWTNDEENPH